MEGGGRLRHCPLCQRNLYDLSDMSRDEAEAIVSAREGKPVADLYERSDGLVMVSDCPVGVREKRDRMIGSTAALIAMLTLVTATWSFAWRELKILPDPIGDHVADVGMPVPRSQQSPPYDPMTYKYCTRHGEYHLHFVKYDPSNGTLSRGDIFRTAKGIFNPWVCVL